MDVEQQDLVIIGENTYRETEDPSFYETLKATYSFNWMPMIERREEFVRFGNRPFDSRMDLAQKIADAGPQYYDHVDELGRARDDEHFDFIKERIDRSFARRKTMAAGNPLAVMGAYIVSPEAALLAIPGFNLGYGATVGGTALRFATSGAMFAAATEARRAPSEYAHEPYEVEMNLAASTVLGGAIGGAFKGAPYMMPFGRSTANKVARIAKGEKIEKPFKDDGSVALDDGTKPAVKVGADEFDLEVNDFISTPMKRALGNKALPKSVKEAFVKLAYNQSLPLAGQKGKATPQSVAARKVTHMGSAFEYESSMRNLYAQQFGQGKAKQVMGVFLQSRKDFDAWYTDTMRRYINSMNPDPRISNKAKQGLTDEQKQAFTIHKNMMDQYDMDARYVGLLQDDKIIEDTITKYQKSMISKQKLIADLDDVRKERLSLTKKQQAKYDEVVEEIGKLGDQIEDLKTALASPTRKNFAFPIYYDKIGLQDATNRESLTQAFTRRYESDRARFPDDTYSRTAREDAERTVARIMEEDFAEFEESLASMPKSKHLAHRKTNVEEWEVSDHMAVTMESMYAYFDRMGSRIEFARAYGGKTVDEILTDIEANTRKARPKGMNKAKWEETVAQTKSDFAAEFDRVMGAAQRNPDRWDNKIAFLAKNYSGWVYLGQAGISAITDVGSVVMAHGFKDTFRAAAAMIADTGYAKALGNQARLGGELLDMNRNLMMRRVIGDSLKRVQPSGTERFVETGNKFFYTANLLGPLTVGIKTLDQILVNDKIVRLSKQRQSGALKPQDEAFLNKYGIDSEMSKYINDMPVSKHESFDFFFANTDEWSRVTQADRDKLRTYQAATSAHANNTVIYGQQFDRPLIVDGITYMKDNAYFRANRAAFPIDERASTRGIKMVRVESGLMSLPFTFMNFAFAANNKILGAIRDPNRLYRLQGVAALLGLSYMSLDIKKPDWWFEKKDSPELLMRVVDHSGVLGLYMDLGYMGMAIAAGTGAYDPEQSIFKPKYQPDLIDAMTEPFGAPIGLASEYIRGANDFINGDMNEGSKRYFYNAPLVGLPWIKSDMQDLVLGSERGRF